MPSASTTAIGKTHVGATLKHTSGRSDTNTAARDTASHASISASLDDTLTLPTTSNPVAIHSSTPPADTTESTSTLTTPTTPTTSTAPTIAPVISTSSTQGPSTPSPLSTSTFTSAGNASSTGPLGVIEPSRNEYSVGELAGGGSMMFCLSDPQVLYQIIAPRCGRLAF